MNKVYGNSMWQLKLNYIHMKNKRREFLKLSGLAGAGIILGTGEAKSMKTISAATTSEV
jgi:hypothetical protein